MSAAARDAYDRIYEGISGHALSMRDRPKQDSSFVYGEIVFDTFVALLARAAPARGEVFCDLGAGTGKAVHAAALSGLGFGRCIGVELLEGLHAASEDARRAIAAAAPAEAATVELRKGDMLEVDWSAADVVYSSSICFGGELWTAMQPLLRKLKPGARFLTLKMPDMADGAFELVDTILVQMSWGAINVHLLRRT